MKKRRKQGFTMVEMIVATAVSAIVILSMVAIISPIYKVYRRTLIRADAQLLAGAIVDTFRAAASNANQIDGSVAERLVIDGSEYYVSDGGFLMRLDEGETEAVLVFAEGFYAGRRVALSCAPYGSDGATITLSVSGDGEPLCQTTATLRSMRSVINPPGGG